MHTDLLRRSLLRLLQWQRWCLMMRVSVFAMAMAGWQCSSDSASQGSGNTLDDASVQTHAALHQFDSCAALTQNLRNSLFMELSLALDNYGAPMMVEDAILPPIGPENDASTSSGPSSPSSGGGAGGASDPRQEGVDFSGTNNQETGVDEADIMKTDGHYVYLFGAGRMRILGIPTAGDLTSLSQTTLEGWPQSVLIHGDRVVVFSHVDLNHISPASDLRPLIQGDAAVPDGPWYPSRNMTKITVLDVHDQGAPHIVRELYLEGSYNTARLTGGTVYMVATAWMNTPQGLRAWIDLPEEYYVRLRQGDTPGAEAIRRTLIDRAKAHNSATLATIPLSDLVPAMVERVHDSAGTHMEQRLFTQADCTHYLATDINIGRTVTSLLSLHLFDATLSYESHHVLGNGGVVYASSNQLVMADYVSPQWWMQYHPDAMPLTYVHRFDISDSTHTRYTGSGSVPGSVHNQFSLSEHHGDVRIATTLGALPGWETGSAREMTNAVYILSGTDSLERVGVLSDIAPGEKIWSVRFVGDKAYLVTFRNTDPLWVVDLSDRTAPRVLGELEIPGVSTYIHPVGDHYLLTIGFGGTDVGLNWRTQVSLFDVQDYAHPRLADSVMLAPPEGAGWEYGWSEATYEHKAFQFWEPLSMLAIPVSTYRTHPLDNLDGNGNGNGNSPPSEEGVPASSGNAGRAASVPISPEYYTYEFVSLLQLIHVDQAQGKLRLFGHVDHGPFYNDDPSHVWSSSDVRRSFFMHESVRGETSEEIDYIYAFSDRGATVNRITEGMPLKTSVALDGTRFW